MASLQVQSESELMSRLTKTISRINDVHQGFVKDKAVALASVQRVYEQIEAKIKAARDTSVKEIDGIFEKMNKECHQTIKDLCDFQER